jgi:hypothetical protein
MKSIICVFLAAGLLSGCAPAESQRIPLSPFIEDYGLGAPYSSNFIYQRYSYIYHPVYVPHRGDIVYHHR